MYKYILFDLDDTLLDFKKSEREAIKLILEKFDLYNLDNYKLFSKINEDCFMEFQNGIIKRRIDFQIKRFDLFFKHFDFNVDSEKINEEFLDNLSNNVFLVDNAYEILEYLYKKYDLFVASNGVYDIQIKRIKKAGLEKFFKKYYISSKIGFNKPDIRFFEAIYNDSLGKKEDYVIIGDRESSDIIGGNNFNIDTIILGDSELAKYRINNLFDLKKIL